MKGAFEKCKRNAPRMLVTAWGAKTRLTLAARPVRDGNEAKAAIELLSLLDIKAQPSRPMRCTARARWRQP